MRKLIAVLALALGIFAAETPTLAQPSSSLRGRTVRQIPTCSLSREGTTVTITDATSQDVIGAGGGTAITVAVCDGTNYVPISATVSNLDGNPSIVLDTDDSGSDITLTPADDLILTPVDALTISAGGVVLLDNTGGATTTLDTDAAGSDIVLTPADDLLETVGDDVVIAAQDFLPTLTGTAVITAPVTTIVASTSVLQTTPISGVSGAREFKVTNVTVADDGAGTKPAGVTPITTDYATCTCNDTQGCTMSVAEPTVTSGYGRLLSIVSVGTGNCEFADSAGVTEIGAALVLEPTSTVTLMYANAAWHRISSTDNVP